MASQFDFVYFDLDDTLLDHRVAERSALAALHTELGGVEELTFDLETLQREYHDSNVELWRQYSLAEITGDQLRHDRFAIIVKRHGLMIDALDLSDRYMELYSRFWVPVEGALDAFRRIADSTPVGIITNGFAATQREKLNRFRDLRDRSSTIVISEEFGHMKPSPKLFAYALSQAGCAAENVLYVGDSWHSDVEGGLASGWNVAWYTPDATKAVGTDVARDRLFAFDAWSDLVRFCTD